MDNQYKEYSTHLLSQEGALYYTGCRLTVRQQWVSDTLIQGNEVLTAAIVQQKLEERGYQVKSVEEYKGDQVGWHAELLSYPSSPEEWAVFLQRKEQNR